MLKIWFYIASAKGKGCIRSRAEERRYREGLFKAAAGELAEIREYVCREGRVYFVVECEDRETVKSIVRKANSGFGKYKKLTGEYVHFDRTEPELLRDCQKYKTIKQQFFNAFYIAE